MPLINPQERATLLAEISAMTFPGTHELIEDRHLVYLAKVLANDAKRQEFENWAIVDQVLGMLDENPTWLGFTYAMQQFREHKRPSAVRLMLRSTMDYLLLDAQGNSIANMLLPKPADIMRARIYQGWTAEEIALEDNLRGILITERIMPDLAAALEANDLTRISALLAIDSATLINTVLPDNDGATLLIAAVKQNKVDVVTLLLTELVAIAAAAPAATEVATAQALQDRLQTLIAADALNAAERLVLVALRGEVAGAAAPVKLQMAGGDDTALLRQIDARILAVEQAIVTDFTDRLAAAIADDEATRLLLVALRGEVAGAAAPVKLQMAGGTDVALLAQIDDRIAEVDAAIAPTISNPAALPGILAAAQAGTLSAAEQQAYAAKMHAEPVAVATAAGVAGVEVEQLYRNIADPVDAVRQGITTQFQTAMRSSTGYTDVQAAVNAGAVSALPIPTARDDKRAIILASMRARGLR